MDCSICCEKFNKSLNAMVKCPNSECEFDVCKSCVRTYLLGTTNDPHCMNCKIQWSEKFLVDNLNRSFVDNDYKKHRKILLVDREISRTPDLMPLVEREKEIDAKEKELVAAEKEYNAIYNQLLSVRTVMNGIRADIHNLRNGDISKDERKKFVMPCPADGCNGFLSTQYKCGLCERYSCPDCMEVKGFERDSPHECKPCDVESVKAIKKDTKGCPKCGVRIFKIEGCDQMWCTECKVAFSWNTGKIVVTGNIHNPHYYQYLRETGQAGQAPRNPGDVVCGGIVYIQHFNSMLRTFKGNAGILNVEDWCARFLPKESKYDPEKLEIITYFDQHKLFNMNDFDTHVSSLHRLVNHITTVDLPRLRQAVRDNTNFDKYTVQYLLSKKTKDELAQIIFRTDVQRKKHNDILQIYELLSASGIEQINNCYNLYVDSIKRHQPGERMNFITNMINALNNYLRLIEYCNDQLALISYTYKTSVSIITLTGQLEFKISSKKYLLEHVNKINAKLDAKSNLNYDKKKGKKKMKINHNEHDDKNIGKAGTSYT